MMKIIKNFVYSLFTVSCMAFIAFMVLVCVDDSLRIVDGIDSFITAICMTILTVCGTIIGIKRLTEKDDED